MRLTNGAIHRGMKIEQENDSLCLNTKKLIHYNMKQDSSINNQIKGKISAKIRVVGI